VKSTATPSDLKLSKIVLKVTKGMVETPYDAEEGRFSLNLMLLKFFTDFTVDVDVSENTLVMTGCDQRVDPSAIQTGMISRVVAKVSLADRSIKAIAVLLKDVNDTGTPTDDTHIPTEVIAMLTAVSDPDEEGGHVLRVEADDNDIEDIYLPAGVEPTLVVPGEDPLSVPIEELQRLTDCGQMLAVNITAASMDMSPPVASAVRVDAVTVEGMVEARVVNGDTVVVELEDDAFKTYSIAVPPTAIVNQDPPAVMPPTNMNIQVYDGLVVLGLNACEADDDNYRAYMVTIFKQ
jgi:hypothetical protein